MPQVLLKIIFIPLLILFSVPMVEAQSTKESYRDALEQAEDLFNQEKYAEVEKWSQRAYELAQAKKDRNGQARALYRIGLAQIRQSGMFTRGKAEKSFKSALELVEDRQLKIAILQELRSIARSRKQQDEVRQITQNIELLQRNIELQLNGKLKRQKAKDQLQAVAEAATQLADSVAILQNNQKKLKVAVSNLTLEQMRTDLLLSKQQQRLDSLQMDSLFSQLELQTKDLQLQSQQNELREVDAELRIATVNRNFLLALAVVIALVAGGLLLRFWEVKKYNRRLEEKNEIIEAEKERSNELLLNILPKVVAEELKITGKATARYYTEATVLFVDFVGFSQVAALLSPQELVTNLDYCFQKFDEIVTSFGIEKIKTIGDAYMCAGGLPSEGTSEPKDLVEAGLKIQEFLLGWNAERKRQNQPLFTARIGIHTGPVVAGVVGQTKFAYDIWGDTVNVAARLETTGAAGEVNISIATYQHVRGFYEVEKRGKLPIKNLGEIEMFFVKKRK